MLLPKELVFKDKTSIDEYIESDELNNDIYEVLLQVREADSSLGRYVLKIPLVQVFNEAYYQATKAMHDKHPEEDFYSNYFYDAKSHLVRAYETDLILSVAYVLVAVQENIGRPQKRFLSCIESKIKNDTWYFPFYKQLVEKYQSEGKTFNTTFEFTDIDFDALDSKNWMEITHKYDKACIQSIIAFSDAPAVKLKFLNAIEKQYLVDIQKDDWECMFLEDIKPFLSELRHSIPAADSNAAPAVPKEPENPLRPRVTSLEAQVEKLQARIGELTMENEELKKVQSDERAIKIRDLVWEAKSYPPAIQISILNLLRGLIADQDENWIERFKAEEDRLAKLANSDKDVPAKKTLCLGVATDLMIILLKKAGITAYADNTKMANLISVVTDYSPEKIRQRISSTSAIPKMHQPEIDAVNTIHEDLNIQEKLPDTR